MIPGEPILIEQVVNGWIVNPKEVTNFTESKKDLYVFETLSGLKRFLDQHFNKPKKEEEK